MMRKTTVYLKNYVGTNYEIGEKIGKWVKKDSQLLKRVTFPTDIYPEKKYKEIRNMLNEFCPGINEEIEGFASSLEINPKQVLFYALTYLERGCSLMAVLPSKTKSGHILMGRNYDFNDEIEEMCFAYTDIKGKYKYIGSTLNLFGRSDGMNKHGLAVCKASNGLPVGNFEGGHQAGVDGFSFWIVLRSILENCKDVNEAIDWVTKAPIAYNINLMLADKNGKIAMIQIIDGHIGYKVIQKGSIENYLNCTNHTTLEKIKPYEKVLIESSVTRNHMIEKMFKEKQLISKKDMKNLLSTCYPNGLCCHYYKEFFGTLHSMIFDITDNKIEISFGSPNQNEWQIFGVEPLVQKTFNVAVPDEKAPNGFYNII